MSRGVDLDAIAISPVPELAELEALITSGAADRGYTRLASIDEVLLDMLMEWHIEGERCVSIGEPISNGGNWRVLYDTQFSHGALADALARGLPNSLVFQVNLQEQVDLTLRVLRGERTVYEYSNAPGFFNWGRCLGQNEPAQLARTECAALAEALGLPGKTAEIEELFKLIVAKKPGEDIGTRGRKKGGVYDAVQGLATLAGIPRLYRFFEGWMKSNLDWDEDKVANVLAFRKNS